MSGSEYRSDRTVESKKRTELGPFEGVSYPRSPLRREGDLAACIAREMSTDRASPGELKLDLRGPELMAMVRVQLAQIGVLCATVVEQGIVEIEEDGHRESQSSRF